MIRGLIENGQYEVNDIPKNKLEWRGYTTQLDAVEIF